MEGDRGDEIEVLIKRLEILDRLCWSPAYIRDLVDDTDHSRSTINRALNDLESLRLVERGERGIQATPVGRLTRNQVRTFLADLDDIMSAEAVLGSLPFETEITPEAIAGCEAFLASDPAPYRPLERINDDLLEATSYRALIPSLQDPRHVRLLYEHVVIDENPASLVISEGVFRALQEEFPRQMAAMARTDVFSLYVGDVPSYGLGLLGRRESSGQPTKVALYLVVLDESGSIHGLIVNDAEDAVQWGHDRYETIKQEAIDRTAELLGEPDGGRSQFRGDGRSDAIGQTLPIRLEREGFVLIDRSYFRSEPVADPPTAWRTGLSIAEVHTGYAIQRSGADTTTDGETYTEPTSETDGETYTGTDSETNGERSFASAITADLAAGHDCLLLGPPGSGKSTVCKQIACEWYEADRGPVLYRESDRGQSFAAIEDLLSVVTVQEGHVLVVVEDAARPGGEAIFDVIERLGDIEERSAGPERVSILLDAREHEWHDRSNRLKAGDELSIRHVPPVDKTDCEQLIAQFERTTGRRIDVPVEELWNAVRDRTAIGEESATNEMLRVVHRLSTYADPLADGPTALEEAVAAVYDEIADDELALSVCLCTNVLNVAGVPIDRASLHAACDSSVYDCAARQAVDRAIDRLEGQVLFPQGNGPYRTVHEAWSTALLNHVLSVIGERAAANRFGTAMSSFLALADDADRRDQIATYVGDQTVLSAIESDPTAWADRTVEELYAAGRERSQLAPLFGDGDADSIELPDACSENVRTRRPIWLGHMFLAGGYYEYAERAFERIEGTALEDVAERLLGLARVKYERSEYDEAIDRCHECLSIVDGNEVLEARSRTQLGQILVERGRYDDAERHYRAALAAFREATYAYEEAQTLLRLGEVAYSRDEYDRADEWYERALERTRELGDRRGQADALNNLASIPFRRGEYDRARQLYERSLDIKTNLGDRHGEAKTLYNLGLIATGSGVYDRATELLERSRTLFGDLGDRHGEAKAVQTLGIIAGRQGRPEARRLYEQCLELYREIDASAAEVGVRNNLAGLLKEKGAYDRAREHFERSLALATEIDDRRGTATAHKNLAEIYRMQGAYDRARQSAERGFELADELGERTLGARARRQLGLVAVRRGQYDRARELLERSYDVHVSIDQPRDVAKTLCDLAALDARTGNDDRARERAAQAVEITTDSGEREQQANAHCRLAALAIDAGRHEQAKRHLEAATDAIEGRGYTVERRLQFVRARLAFARDDVETARSHAEAALNAYDDLGRPYRRAQCSRLLARIERHQDETQAVDRFHEAIETFEDLGAVDDALETLCDLERMVDDEAAHRWRDRARRLLAAAPESIRRKHESWIGDVQPDG